MGKFIILVISIFFVNCASQQNQNMQRQIESMREIEYRQQYARELFVQLHPEYNLNSQQARGFVRRFTEAFTHYLSPISIEEVERRVLADHNKPNVYIIGDVIECQCWGARGREVTLNHHQIYFWPSEASRERLFQSLQEKRDGGGAGNVSIGTGVSRWISVSTNNQARDDGSVDVITVIELDLENYFSYEYGQSLMRRNPDLSEEQYSSRPVRIINILGNRYVNITDFYAFIQESLRNR